MLTWLRNLCRRSGSRYDLYSPRERQIFSYFDGQKVVQADPLVLYKRMMDVGPELAIDIKVANSESKDATKAHSDMISKIYQVFGLKPFAEGGVTEAEAVVLLETFWRFTDQIKKKLPISTTSSMETLAAANPSSAGPYTTTSPSASGCSANGISTARQAPLPSAPVLPSA